LHFNVVDGVALALGVAAAIDGARRGFSFYALELTALVCGLAIALAGYGPLIGLLKHVLTVDVSLGGFVAFLFLLVLGHGLVQLGTQRRITEIGSLLQASLDSRRYRLASAAPAAALAGLLTLLMVSSLAVIPNDFARDLVSGSAMAPTLTSSRVLYQPLHTLLIPSPTPTPILDIAPESNPGEDAFYKLKLPLSLRIVLNPEAENQMLVQINQARSHVGLSPLNPDPRLRELARSHSSDMYRHHYFSHRTPDGKTPYDRLNEVHFRYVTTGENVAFANDESKAWDALMNSPDHRANILNPDFRCVGIGVYRGLDGFEEMFTQEFADCEP
jgi:uncharacterized protein YkwD